MWREHKAIENVKKADDEKKIIRIFLDKMLNFGGKIPKKGRPEIFAGKSGVKEEERG